VGSIENDFLNYIQQHDSANRMVLFPGCGYGRSVLDALAKTKNTFMIANDLSEAGLDKLAEAQMKWFPDAANRLAIKRGNIFDIISELEDESVDTVFCTHLIHFFNPIEIENFFYQLNRVLKKNGTIFLAWEGFAEAFEYQDLQSEFKDFYRIINKLYKANNPYPTYLDRANLPKDLESIVNSHLPRPHNFITLAEVLEVSSAHGFTCPAYKLSKPIMTSLVTVTNTVVASFHCLEEAIGDEQKLECFPNFNLKLNKSHNDTDTTQAYSKNFKNGVWEKHIENHLCDQCRLFTEKISTCSACKNAKYCGPACQRLAWSLHKHCCTKQ
jgi:SAM-dependent methyltransferase